MPDDSVLTEKQLEEALEDLPDWEVRDGWLRRQYQTPGFAHTMMLANTVGYLAEAAWHPPDMSVGYAHLTVKLQTHRIRAVTTHDTELACKIDEVVTWLPGNESVLDGFPKKWID